MKESTKINLSMLFTAITVGAFATGLLYDNYAVYNKLEESYNQNVEELESLKEDYKPYIAKNNEIVKENKEIKRELNKYKSKPVFSEYDLNKVSYVTEEGLTKALKNTNLESLASSFIKAEDTYNVNALLLASVVAQESGWGTSRRAIETNNMTGYAVYNDMSIGEIFKTKEDNIMETARLLRVFYMNEGLAEITKVNKKYSEDKNWHKGIVSIAKELQEKSDLSKF